MKIRKSTLFLIVFVISYVVQWGLEFLQIQIPKGITTVMWICIEIVVAYHLICFGISYYKLRKKLHQKH